MRYIFELTLPLTSTHRWLFNSICDKAKSMSSRSRLDPPQAPKMLPREHAIPAPAVTAVNAPTAIRPAPLFVRSLSVVVCSFVPNVLCISFLYSICLVGLI